MRLVQVLCGALAYAGVAQAVATYHVTVDAMDELCFFEDLQANDPLGMSFQVTFGGFLDIDVAVSVCGRCTRTLTWRQVCVIIIYENMDVEVDIILSDN